MRAEVKHTIDFEFEIDNYLIFTIAMKGLVVLACLLTVACALDLKRVLEALELVQEIRDREVEEPQEKVHCICSLQKVDRQNPQGKKRNKNIPKLQTHSK